MSSRRFVLVFALLLLAPACLFAAGENARPPMRPADEDHSGKGVAAFIESLETEDDFRNVEAAIASARPAGSADSREARRREVRLWLKAFARLQEKKDPAFSSEDVPQLNVAPPGGLDSGIAPESIENPDLRRQYEEALRENAEKAQAYALQETLRDLEPRWEARLSQAVAEAYPADEDLELRSVLEDEIGDVALRERLWRAVANRPSSGN